MLRKSELLLRSSESPLPFPGVRAIFGVHLCIFCVILDATVGGTLHCGVKEMDKSTSRCAVDWGKHTVYDCRRRRCLLFLLWQTCEPFV